MAAEPLSEALNEAFALYIHELTHCRTLGGYLGTLHIACSVPDVCGALASPDGQSSGPRYMAWADRHLAKGDAKMTAADWYKMRCAVLHQGSSLPVDQRGKAVSQYAAISFVTPENSKPEAHRVVLPISEGPNITLNIAAIADEMLTAMKDWFDWLHRTEAAIVRGNVKQRLGGIVSPRWKMWPDLPNPGITWSSSGAIPIITIDYP
jgi:hypothetical protein